MEIYQPAEDSFFFADFLKIYLSENAVSSYLDMGTGSGILAKTAEKFLDNKKILGADINSEAVSELKKCGFSAIESNLFENVDGFFDLITFNAPYLPLDSREPVSSRIATTGGKDGDEVSLRFLEQAVRYLSSGGKIFLLISSLTPRDKINRFNPKVVARKEMFMEELLILEFDKLIKEDDVGGSMVEHEKRGEETWEIPKTGGMNVPVGVFASENLMEKIKEDSTLKQAVNMASMRGVRGVAVCPDAHQGYGACIGGVAVFDLEEGVVSPGEIGYDINCSIRLLKTNLREKDLDGKETSLLRGLRGVIHSGLGAKGNLLLDEKELNEVLIGGAQWAVSKNYGVADDWKFTEDEGKMSGANPAKVSQRAKGRGMKQLGTLGAGNHFLDVLIVDDIFDDKIAKVFGLERGQVVILIHCGSRGLGHQVASDYIREMEEEYGDLTPNRELVGAPIKSDLGRSYLSAMASAANFAFANKQVITHLVREEMKRHFPEFKAEVVYDICHNIAKIEEHVIDEKREDVLVVRKGATRSFGAGRKEIVEKYRKVGQPVLLPGSMGASSYVLVGTKKAEELSWGSCAHGAGRAMSRGEVRNKIGFLEAVEEMKRRGIFVEAGSKKMMVEESPTSYKDIEEVARVCDKIGLAKKVAKLRPKLVLIG